MEYSRKEMIKHSLEHEFEIGGLVWDYAVTKGVIFTNPDGSQVENQNEYLMTFSVYRIENDEITFRNSHGDMFKMPTRFATCGGFRKDYKSRGDMV